MSSETPEATAGMAPPLPANNVATPESKEEAKEGVPDALRRRITVFSSTDILQTEERYVEALRRLHELYYKDMAAFVEAHPTCALGSRELELLVPGCTLQLLHNYHGSLLTELRPAVKALQDNLDPTLLAQAYVKHCAYFKIYVSYCQQQFERIALLKRMQEDSEVAAELDRLQELHREGFAFGTLESELGKPFQRVMRYDMLLMELAKLLGKCGDGIPASHLAVVQGAKAKVKAVLSEVNDASAWVTHEKVSTLLDSIDALPCALTNKRSIKMRDAIYKITVDDTACQLLLFDDSTLVAKEATGRVSLLFNMIVQQPCVLDYDAVTARVTMSDEVGERVSFVVREARSLVQDTSSKGVDAARRCYEDLVAVATAARRRAPVRSIHPVDQWEASSVGFPSCTMDAWARVRCAVVVLALSSLYCLGSWHHRPLPEGGLSGWNRVANRLLKLFGYFLPFGWVLSLRVISQCATVGRAEMSRFKKEIQVDIVSWLYIYMVARFAVEPLSNIVCPVMSMGGFSLTQGEGSKGVASHAIMSLIAWGYAMLATDSTWFSLQAVFRSPLVGTLLTLLFAFLAFLYLQMAYITTMYFHTFQELLAALAVAVTVLLSYVMAFDKLTDRLRYTTDPGAGTRTAFTTAFVACAAFILLLTAWVAGFRLFFQDDFRLASQFWLYLPLPLAGLCLGVGGGILYYSHRELASAMFAPVWVLLCGVALVVVKGVVVGLLCALDLRCPPGVASSHAVETSGVLLCASFATCFQAWEVARHLDALSRFSHKAEAVSLVGKGVLGSLPLVYFLLFSQLLGHVYSTLLHLQAAETGWVVPLVTTVALVPVATVLRSLTRRGLMAVSAGTTHLAGSSSEVLLLMPTRESIPTLGSLQTTGVYLCVALLLVAVLVSVLMKNMMAVGLCAPLLLVAMQYADQLKPSQSKEHAS